MSERESVIQRVISWLRAGYPEGVPHQDYVALLGVLHRRLSPDEITGIADELATSAAEGGITRDEIREMIRQRTHQSASVEDISRVSARLAAGGWPLADPNDQEEQASDGAVRRAVGGIVAWLRAGYPQGVPDNDYIPLVALLRRRLSDEELEVVASQLAEEGLIPAGKADIGAAILRLTNEMPSDSDIHRVEQHLAEHEQSA